MVRSDIGVIFGIGVGVSAALHVGWWRQWLGVTLVLYLVSVLVSVRLCM